MVKIRIMGMRVRQRFVVMRVRMRLGVSHGGVVRAMLVLMMLIVHMGMVMVHRGVMVLMLVSLGQM